MIEVSDKVDAQELRYMRDEEVAKLIDVRSPAEFSEFHIEGSVNIPLEQLKEVIEALTSCSDIVLVCQTGKRAAKASRILFEKGFDAKVLQGGIESWRQLKLPVIGSQAAISVQRQVRIASGFLVLFSLLLSVAFGPWALALAGFVGCGLVYAGLSGNCGLELLLAACPWNEAKRQIPTKDHRSG